MHTSTIKQQIRRIVWVCNKQLERHADEFVNKVCSLYVVAAQTSNYRAQRSEGSSTITDTTSTYTYVFRVYIQQWGFYMHSITVNYNKHQVLTFANCIMLSCVKTSSSLKFLIDGTICVWLSVVLSSAVVHMLKSKAKASNCAWCVYVHTVTNIARIKYACKCMQLSSSRQNLTVTLSAELLYW
jgi:hypothetical protein